MNECVHIKITTNITERLSKKNLNLYIHISICAYDFSYINKYNKLILFIYAQIHTQILYLFILFI